MPRTRLTDRCFRLRRATSRGGSPREAAALGGAVMMLCVLGGAAAPATPSAGAIGTFERLSAIAIGVSPPTRPEPAAAAPARSPERSPAAARAASPAPASRGASPSDLCDAAIAEAAARHGAPERLLRSIALVESGRTRDGERRPWPWTVNMEGEGRWFDTRDEALAYVRRHQAAGAKSFDVGCLQVNHYWHGDAFESLEAMIEPRANADYAARYLAALQAETGDWMRAAGFYHSRNPEPFKRYSALIADAYESAAARRLTPPDALRVALATPAEPRQPARLALFDAPAPEQASSARFQGLLRLAAEPAAASPPSGRSILDGLPAATPTAAAPPGGVGVGAFAASGSRALLAPAQRPMFGAPARPAPAD